MAFKANPANKGKFIDTGKQASPHPPHAWMADSRASVPHHSCGLCRPLGICQVPAVLWRDFNVVRTSTLLLLLLLYLHSAAT